MSLLCVTQTVTGELALEYEQRQLSLADFSPIEMRRAQYPEAVQAAYAAYAEWVATVQANPRLTALFTYRGVFLPPLFQRHLTERLLEHYRTAVALTPILTQLRPQQLHLSPASLAPFLHLPNEIQLVTFPSNPYTWRTVGQNWARHLLYWGRSLNPKQSNNTPVPTLNNNHDSAKPTLMFVVYYPNHMRYFLPIWQQLQQTGAYHLLVTGSNPSSVGGFDPDVAPLVALGIPFIPFAEALSRRAYAPLVATIPQQIRTLRQTLSHFASPMRPLLDYLLSHYLPKILLHIEMGQALWSKWQPDLVVLTDETLPVLGRVSIVTARQQGIPTLTLQHGVLLADPMYFGGVFADRIGVWGEQPRQMLTHHGADSDQIMMVGAPQFDHHPLPDPDFSYAAFAPQLAGKRVVLFTSQPGGRDVSLGANAATFMGLLTAVCQAPAAENLFLVLKPHPVQTDSELMEWQRQAAIQGWIVNEHYVILPQIPLHAALPYTAVCVTIFSTTGLEALWRNCPLLVINLTDKPDMVDYTVGGAALVAHSSEEIWPQLRLALDPTLQQQQAPARQQLAQAYMGPTDGQALSRITQLIHQTLALAPQKKL